MKKNAITSTVVLYQCRYAECVCSTHVLRWATKVLEDRGDGSQKAEVAVEHE